MSESATPRRSRGVLQYAPTEPSNATAETASHRRRSVRLQHYDYAQPGAYFVTICTHNREALFGQITDGMMVLNEAGRLVEDEWLNTAAIRPGVELDAFIVMPDHLHGIVVI